MANSTFNELALRYVLAEKDQERDIAEKAATIITESPNNRAVIGQWVASINRWIHPDDEDGDDFIARAKALDFLAHTLEVLNRNGHALKADQVKLLVTFFASLFSSDHRAGVAASARALTHLSGMKAFQPSLGNDIVESICKLGDGFKQQTPATRLELYELLLRLFRDPTIANDLEYRHGNTCGFMTDLLGLCRNERDPLNLLKWFEILRTFLQTFSPSEEVTSEVFKTFSAYFPISLRASATPSGVTADKLKIAVRSCFAAHHRLAGLAIPYLLNKLDQGDAVTVAVKVDILQTIDASLAQYQHPQKSVVPFVDQIWGSLKYEVRNGEIADTIKATLKVITTLTKRLDVDELRSFVGNAWRDLGEDLSNPTYTAQAGRLLVAIAGATIDSFAIVTPQAISHIKTTLKHTNSAQHKQHLAELLTSILLLRAHLVDELEAPLLPDNGGQQFLKDDLFSDTLFNDVYKPLWQECSASSSPAENVGIVKAVMAGVAALMGQKSSCDQPPQRLCSDAMCEMSLRWMADPALVCPLEDRAFLSFSTDHAATPDLQSSAAMALKNAVPRYPPAFRHLLLQFLASVKTAYQSPSSSNDLASQITVATATLCEISSSQVGESNLSLSNHVSLLNTLQEGLLWMLSQQAHPRFWTAFVCSLRLAVGQVLAPLSSRGADGLLTAELYAKILQEIEGVGPAGNDHGSNLEMISNAFEGMGLQDVDIARRRIAYCLWVVGQLYRRFTTVKGSEDSSQREHSFSVGLQQELMAGTDEDMATSQQDICLHQLGMLATEVVRFLHEDEQSALQLDREAFYLFHGNIINGTTPSLSASDSYRTAPLSMGVLQGLWPGAISVQYHIRALDQLCTVLTSTALPSSDLTRAALDTMFVILSNKLSVKGHADLADARRRFQQFLGERFSEVVNTASEPGLDASTALRIFRSILHYLAGDVARFEAPPNENVLLHRIFSEAPLGSTFGRQVAQSFEVLASPKECLDAKNHARLKKLSGGWLYSRYVSPYLPACLPKDGSGESSQAVNRAVATFAILKHLQYDQYSSDVGAIARVGVRSLSTFGVDVAVGGPEMESCLSVLLRILEHEPAELRDHLAGITNGMLAVYQQASRSSSSSSRSSREAAVRCRKLALEFFRRLPEAYEARYLLPHRPLLLRPLSAACGDSVRETRRIALRARQAWEDVN
ncbi:Dos2-interacting transcription regulator of RNA-Pol-II-domain-containing protein [Xylariaceae sp. FL0804]|nr:Dos2-interacting transcription regulator of RNA-Pol-II-domain-containing protein [Xylariaceae sp. FL0804]